MVRGLVKPYRWVQGCLLLRYSIHNVTDTCEIKEKNTLLNNHIFILESNKFTHLIETCHCFMRAEMSFKTLINALKNVCTFIQCGILTKNSFTRKFSEANIMELVVWRGDKKYNQILHIQFKSAKQYKTMVISTGQS